PAKTVLRVMLTPSTCTLAFALRDALPIYQHHAALVAQGELAMHLEWAAHALEAGQPLNDGLVAYTLISCHGNGRQSIEHVVHAGHVDKYLQRLAAFAQDGEVGLHALLFDIHGADVGVFGLAVGDHLTVDLRQDIPHHRIIDAEHRQTVERQVVQEVDEGALQAVEVAFVGGHVIEIDIGDDGGHRLQVQEGG